MTAEAPFYVDTAYHQNRLSPSLPCPDAGKVLENELSRRYKREETHNGRGPKLSEKPRTMSVHAQIHVNPHQLPGHLIKVLRVWG
jgi:hypothetical protein